MTAFYEKLVALLPADSPRLLVVYKVAIAIAGFFIIWIILRWLLHFVERLLKKFEFIQANSQVFQIIRRVLLLALLLVVGSYVLRMTQILLLVKIFHALLIILLAVPVKNFLSIAIGFLQSKIAHRTENKIDDIIFELLSRFAGFIIIATAIIIALDSLGVNVMPFIAGDRPFEVGDRIEVWTAPSGSSTWGDVIDIGLRATKIKTTDNIVIIIPNNEIMLRDIINYTTISEQIRVRINIGIAYDADMQLAKDIIVKVANSADWVAKQPPPKVVVRHFGESAVDLQLRVWIHDARQRMNTISYITDRVKSAFDQHGVEIPYPKRDVYVKTGNLAE